MTLECVDNIEGCDGLALGVLSVGNCVADDTLEEGLEDTTSLFVDHWRGSQKMSQSRRRVEKKNLLAEIRLTPPRRARRRIAGFVIPWMLSRKIFRWRLAPPLPRPLPPLPPAMEVSKEKRMRWYDECVLTSSHFDEGCLGCLV